MKIAGRTFVISGGSSGLGLATASRLHKHGAYVALLDLSAAPASPSGSRVRYYKTDISSTQEVEHAVESTVAWAQETGAPLGGVINAAGVGIVGKIVDNKGTPLSLDVLNFTLAVNVTGTFNLTRLVCKHLIDVAPEGPDGERGVVIMVTSAAAFEGLAGQATYAASKGAVRSMTLPLARDLARYGIRVNTIAPGIFVSGMTARMPEKSMRTMEREAVFPRRFGKGEEFAETVEWMVECAFMNGETIRLSGAGRLPGRL